MADLTDIQAAASIKIIGSDSTGLETTPVNADINGNLQVIDYADGPVTPGTVASRSTLIGGQFNTSLPTLTTAQQCALQVDSSGRLIIAPTTQGALAEDHNWGTVGATTLRSAAQIGNATGAADFAAGNSSAQTLRVVIATNQAALPVTGTFWQATQPVSGTFWQATQPVSGTVAVTQSTSPWVTKDQSDGPVTPGAVASFSQLAGGQYNSVLPTLTSGQQVALQLDSSGRLLTALALSNDTNYGTVGANTLRTAAQIGNATGAAAFGAGTTTAQVLRVVLPTDQTAIPVTGTFWQATQPVSGTFWQATQPISATALPLPAGASTSALQTTGNTSLATIVTNTTNLTVAQASTTSGQTGQLVQGAVTTNPPAYTTGQTDPLSLTRNGDLRVADIVNDTGQNRAQSVTTAAAEALGAAAILVDRKVLSITPTNGTVYWGYSNAVTTVNGSPIFQNQCKTFAVGSNVHIYVIAAATTDCRVAEGS